MKAKDTRDIARATITGMTTDLAYCGYTYIGNVKAVDYRMTDPEIMDMLRRKYSAITGALRVSLAIGAVSKEESDDLDARAFNAYCEAVKKMMKAMKARK